MKTDVDTALRDIADWYVKNRREITEPELESILLKHCEDEAEVQKFIIFLGTESGQMRFKTLLRERKGESSGQRAIDNVEVYTSEALPPDIAEATGLHSDPEVQFRYTTYYYGPDLGLFQRDLQKLLRERTGIPYLAVDAYYIQREFKPGEVVRYKGERVRVLEHIGDRVFILIPSRQEEVWVKADILEKVASSPSSAGQDGFWLGIAGAERKFPLGQIVMTRGVNDLVAENAEFAKFASESLRRHASGDWGDLTEEDKRENEYALGKYLRLFSAYEKYPLPKIWIITEADRSATTILFPGEY